MNRRDQSFPDQLQSYVSNQAKNKCNIDKVEQIRRYAEKNSIPFNKSSERYWSKLFREVFLTISAFCCNSVFCATLYELQEYLENVFSCEIVDLGIGNLATYGLCADFFKAKSVLKITTSDVITACNSAKRNKNGHKTEATVSFPIDFINKFSFCKLNKDS